MLGSLFSGIAGGCVRLCICAAEEETIDVQKKLGKVFVIWESENERVEQADCITRRQVCNTEAGLLCRDSLCCRYGTG